MAKYVGLIRGINVGGGNLVKMAELRAFLEGLGLQNPKTLLQSGNFVFESDERSTERLEQTIMDEAAQKLSLNVLFYVRTLEDWEKAIAANPFPEFAKEDPSHLLLYIFAEPPSEASLQEIREAYAGQEEFRLAGDCLYVCFPVGVGVSKLGEHKLWKRLTAKATGRNWNTVLKLAVLAAG